MAGLQAWPELAEAFALPIEPDELDGRRRWHGRSETPDAPVADAENQP